MNTSAATFATGGLLAARIGGARPGMVLDIYHGGTGVGIVASALLVPPLAARAVVHAWQGAWWALAAAALLAGQIVGPVFTGWIADGSSGLLRGLAVSALLLAVGALLAVLQRPLSAERP